MIKNISKTGFRFILSLSLVFTPSLSYSQQSAGGHDTPEPDAIQKILDSLTADHQGRDISPEVQEAARILEEIGVAFEEHSLAQYIDSKPELKARFDTLSLGNQEVRVLNYKEETEYVIAFDTGNNAFGPYPRKVVEIEVDFNDAGNLELKGVIVSEDIKTNQQKRIGLIHTFNDVKKTDVVAWSYDQEFLVILHKTRGLILYHTVIARELLGSTPIPSINLPASRDLLNLLENEESVKLEFIKSSTSHPLLSGLEAEEEKEKARNKGVQFNLAGKPMFTAGDLLVSRTDSEGNKHIVQVISRQMSFLRASVFMYQALTHLIQIKNLKTNKVNTPSPVDHLLRILSANFNRKPIAFFNTDKELLVEALPGFLLEKIYERKQDVFTEENWKEEGPKDTKEGTLKDELKKRLKNYGGNTLGILFFALLALYQSFNRPQFEWSSGLFPTAVWNMVFLGLLLPCVVYLVAMKSIPFLKRVKHILPGDLKLTVETIIEKWGKEGISTFKKILAFSFQILSVFLPTFKLILSVFSLQKPLFDTLRHGINPFQKITPESHLGKGFQLTQPVRLGFWRPQWLGGSSSSEQRKKLIDTFTETRNRVYSVASLMAYSALTNRSEFDFRKIITGPELRNATDLIASYHIEAGVPTPDQSEKKMRDVLWVSQKLSKYILESDFDADRSTLEWDVTRIQTDFYQKALVLAEEVKSISWTQQKTHEVLQFIKPFLTKILSFNTEMARVLKNYFPENTVVNQYRSGFIVDHLMIVIAPLTFLTPRGEAFLGNISKSAVVPYTITNSSRPHLFEINMNAFIHTVVSARQQLQYLLLGKYEQLREIYDSLDTTLYQSKLKPETENVAYPLSYTWDFFRFPWPFLSRQWGKQVYAGQEHFEQRVDPGYQAWEFAKNQMRLWSITIPVFIVLRELFTPGYSFGSNVRGALLFSSLGFFIFAFPQMWVIWHDSMFTKQGEERKAIIDSIRRTADRMKRRNYESILEFDSAYKEALRGFHKLYHSSTRGFKEEISSLIDKFEPKLKEFIKQPNFESKFSILIHNNHFSQEDKIEQMRAISSTLNTRYLPTKHNEGAFQLLQFVTLGLLSNIFFVFVSNESFRNPSWSRVGKWFVIYLIFMLGYKFLSGHSIRDHLRGESLKDTKVGRPVRRTYNQLQNQLQKTKNRCISAFRRNRE